MNTELLKDLDTAVEYFTVVNHYNNLINDYKADIEFQRDKYWQLKLTKKPFALVCMAIIFAIVVVNAFTIATISASELPQGAIGPVFFIITAVGIVSAVLYALHRIKLQKSIAKSAEDFWQNEGGEISNSDEKTISEISAALEEFSENNCTVLQKIPVDYRDFSAVYFMANAVRNMRASTIGEAINLYEEDLQRTLLQYTMDEFVMNQRSMSEELYRINESRLEANRHLKNIENLQIFDMLSH